MREELSIGEKVFLLPEKIKKKSAPGKFYKQSVQNISYFNKEKTFIIRAIQTIDKIKYYWLKNSETIRKLPERLMRTELFFLLGTTFLNLKPVFVRFFVTFNKLFLL